MPMTKFFSERIRYFEELPFLEAYVKFEEPINSYESAPVLVESHIVSVITHEVPVLVYRPADAGEDLPALIWMHGGGFSRGTYTMNEGDIVARELAHLGQLAVINVEYRLVTESVKFPAPQDDCMAVLDWVIDNATSLGISSKLVFVGGVSAGGCLAATMAVLDRDRGTNYVAGQLLNCPVLHHSLPEPSKELSAKLLELGKFIFTDEMVAQLNSFAVTDGELAESDPRWWAGEVKDLRGLPPTQIINCEYDSLRSSGEAYAKALAAAGVSVEVVTEMGVTHAHLNRIPLDCPEHGVTLQRILKFIKTRIHQIQTDSTSTTF